MTLMLTSILVLLRKNIFTLMEIKYNEMGFSRSVGSNKHLAGTDDAHSHKVFHAPCSMPGNRMGREVFHERRSHETAFTPPRDGKGAACNYPVGGYENGKPCCKLRGCHAPGHAAALGQNPDSTRKKIDAALGLLKLLRLSRRSLQN
jgi:hypothetical protein